MKKLICTLLSVILVLGLAACGSQEPVPTTNPLPPETNESTAAPTAAPTEAKTLPAAPEPETTAWALENLVYTRCDKTYVWKDSDGNTNTVQITLPGLYPVGDFVESYNSDLEYDAESYFSKAAYAMENEKPAYTLSVSYDAWLNGSLLTILITRQDADREPSYEVVTFDLDAQKQLTVADLSQRLLGMNYPAFLLAGSEFMAQEYYDTYYQPDMTEEELETFDVCQSSIDHEPWLLLSRELFLNEAGEIMFLYPRIRPTDDWYAGVNSDDAIVAVDPEQFQSPMGEAEAMQWLLSLHASGMGADEEILGYILINAFMADPDGFAGGLLALDEEQRDQAIDGLFYSLWDENKPAFRDVCIDLLARDSLPEDVEEILYQLLDRAL